MECSRPIAVIVDGTNNLYRYFHTQPPKTHNGQRVESAAGLYSFAHKLIKEFEAKFKNSVFMAVVTDADGKNFRHEIYPKYKSERKGMPAELKVQEPIAEKLLELSGIPVLSQVSVEADDIIGILKSYYVEAGQDVIIVTTDKDLFQLVDDNVSTYNPISKKFYNEAAVIEKTGVKPSDIPLLLAIQGDDVDGITGIPGVGDKTAAKLVNTYKTLDGLLERKNEIKGVLGESVRAFSDNLELNLRLTTVMSDRELISPANLLKVWGVPAQEEALKNLKIKLGMESPETSPLISRDKSVNAAKPDSGKATKKAPVIDYDDAQLGLF